MLEFGSYEAKTKLPELLRKIEVTQEDIIITKFGEPIAKLSPIKKEDGSVYQTIMAIKSLRQDIKKDDMSIRQMIEEGRRF